MKWLESILPDNKQIDGVKDIVAALNEKLKNIEIGNIF